MPTVIGLLVIIGFNIIMKGLESSSGKSGYHMDDKIVNNIDNFIDDLQQSRKDDYD